MVCAAGRAASQRCRVWWKPFGLALGLGVAGGYVLLADAEQRQDVFERVAPAGEPGGVDAAVIGQR